MSDKVTDDAKGIVKHLDGSSDALSLEDLNTARQTVTRIEAMIEIEKKLSELDKLRNERMSAGHSSLASAVPASALAPLPIASSAMPPMPLPASAVIKPVDIKDKDKDKDKDKEKEKEKPKLSASSLEVSRIVGTEGKYSAVIKLPSGELKPVRVGDTVADHMTVRWISASSVLVEEGGETHTLRIRNVDAIFSAMR